MKGTGRYCRLTIWKLVLMLMLLSSVYAVYLRRMQGWGSQTYLKEIFPWGLCAGLDVLCGLAVAVGGFTVAAVLYLLRNEIYRPILRTSLIAGYLGFLAAVLSTLANRPMHFWALARLWTPRWAVLGLGSALVLYSTLLALEFGPEMLDRARAPGQSGWRYYITAVLAVSAAVVSALHQSSLTRVLLIAPDKFSSLWLTPMLPALLLLSSICAALAVVVIASWHAGLAFDRKLSPGLLAEIARAMSILLSLYVSLRFVELLDMRVLPLLFENHVYNYLLALELCLFLVPALWLIRERGGWSAQKLYVCMALVLAGFMTNRLNIGITAREAAAGVFYVPQWMDIVIAYGIVALGVALFSLAVKHLSILPLNGESNPAT